MMLIILSFFVCFIVYGQSNDEYKRMVEIRRGVCRFN